MACIKKSPHCSFLLEATWHTKEEACLYAGNILPAILPLELAYMEFDYLQAPLGHALEQRHLSGENLGENLPLCAISN